MHIYVCIMKTHVTALVPVALLVISIAHQSYGGDFFPETYPSLNSTSCPDTTPLFFGLIMSFDGQQFDGSDSVAGVRVALDRINSNCSMLPGYSLHYTLADSRCMRGTALDALHRDTIFSGPTKIAMIGSGCSPATEPTAEVSHYYNISQLSCVSSSPALTNRPRFRAYFQLFTSHDALALAHFGVIQQYRWSRVSLIVQNENLFTVTIDRLKTLLAGAKVEYTETLFSSDGGIGDLGEQPFRSDHRIHIIAAYAGHTNQLLCEAYIRGIRLPRYVLITPGWYDNYWWRMEDDHFNYSCTADEREEVLKNNLVSNFFNRNNSNLISDDGLTAEEFSREEAKFVGVPPLNLTESDYNTQFCYDATWTLVYALQKTIKDVQNNETNQKLAKAYSLDQVDRFQLNHFSYDSDALLKIIFDHISDTSFNGMSGHVGFSDQGVRTVNQLRIFQFRENSTGSINWVEIGEVSGDQSNDTSYTFQYHDDESDNTVWPEGIPYDGTPTNETIKVGLALTVIYSVCASAGVVFAGFCLIFNFIFRETKLIRLTSPNLNYMIGAGAIILYVNLFFFVIPTSSSLAVSVLCNITPWLTAIGYSLCYGTIVAKMIRVYYIFYNPTPKKKAAMKDWMLSLSVLLLVLIDVVILLVYTAVEGSKTHEDGLSGLAARIVSLRENPEELQGVQGIVTRNFIYVCDTTARDILLAVLYGYKAILQIIALIFSFSIRKVKVKGLDDAKFIAAAIYVSSIVLAVVIVSTYTLKDFRNAFPAVFCTGFFIGTTVILGLVFIPLMYALHKDPLGERIFFKTDRSGSMGTSMMVPGSDQTEMINTLKRRVTELETIMSNKGREDSDNSVHDELETNMNADVNDHAVGPDVSQS